MAETPQTDPVEILLKYWKHSAFRPQQEDIVQSALRGEDTLALLPTGGGKSVCFQVPGLMREGLCIVVSPLIALMSDQVDNLNARGIRAAALHSLLRFSEIDSITEQAARAELDFLYLSPERLHTPIFVERIKRTRVGLIAIDEAHCISQWGHDFRPAYRRIAELREILPGVPVIALTATATPEVAKDIAEQLAFRNYNFFKSSFRRDNLHYVVRSTEDKYGKLLEICRAIPGTAIVYGGTRRRTVEIAAFLRQHEIHAEAYHAGIPATEKQRIQNEWIRGKIRIIAATNAFGMGIDKPDVRLVVHFDLPSEPEAYFQEAGRAGRDLGESWCVLLSAPNESKELFARLEERFPEREFIIHIYNLLHTDLRIAEGAGAEGIFPFNPAEFSGKYGFNPAKTYYALHILELSGYIQLSEGIRQPSRLLFTCTRNQLYDFQLRNAALDPFCQMLIRSYSGLFELPVKIDERQLAGRLAQPVEKIKAWLRKLEESGLAAYTPASDAPSIKLLTDRLKSENLLIPHEVYLGRKEVMRSRAQVMRRYVEAQTCRTNVLLDYFGESGAAPCGMCDICLSSQKGTPDPSAIMKSLENGEKTSTELMQELHCNEKSLLGVLRKMQDERLVETGAEGNWRLIV